MDEEEWKLWEGKGDPAWKLEETTYRGDKEQVSEVSGLETLDR